MATAEHGITISSKLRDLAGQFRQLRTDRETGTPDPTVGFRLLSTVRADKLQVEVADVISTASQRGLLTDVPGLRTLVQWHADTERNDEPLPQGAHSRLVRCALNLFWQIHDQVLAKLEPRLFRRQHSVMVRRRGGKPYVVVSDPPRSFAEIDHPRANEATDGAIERLHRIEELTSSAMLCEWFAERVEADLRAVKPDVVYMPASWFQSEFGIPPERLRAARRRKTNPLPFIVLENEYRYSVQAAMQRWPADVLYLPGGRPAYTG